MPVFAYKGVATGGKAVSGTRDAETPKVLRQLMRKEGIVVTDVSESKGSHVAGAGKGLNKDVDLGGIFGGVSAAERAEFVRNMSILLRAGISLATALQIQVEQADNLRFKTPLAEIRTMVNEGRSFADAMAKHPKIFNELSVSMVRAGETAGNLDEVLSRLADFEESSIKLKSKVQSAMIYPTIMMIVAILIVGILMIKVVPQLTFQLKSQGKTLPWNTKLIVWMSNTAQHYWLPILIGMGVAVYAFTRWVRSPEGRKKFDAFVLTLPKLSSLSRQINAARFSRTMATMMRAGVPMLRGLEISKQVLSNMVLRDTIDVAKQAVTEGDALATTLRRSAQFPGTMVKMIEVGEQSGQLEEMLQKVAENYEGEVDRQLTKFTAMLEPLMIVAMSMMVGFIVISILTPLMDLGQIGGKK